MLAKFGLGKMEKGFLMFYPTIVSTNPSSNEGWSQALLRIRQEPQEMQDFGMQYKYVLGAADIKISSKLNCQFDVEIQIDKYEFLDPLQSLAKKEPTDLFQKKFSLGYSGLEILFWFRQVTNYCYLNLQRKHIQIFFA